MLPERFYITTPIYYVNDQPHTGHAYTTVLADVLAGYHRMLGVPTWFLTGTDEHGQKVQDAAEARGVAPQALCDETSQQYRELFTRLEIHNDDFIRTTEPRHTEVVTKVLAKLHEQGDVYLDTYEGWYCTRCERYWTDKEVEDRGGGRCPDFPEQHEVIRLAEENYYFRMSAYADRLKAAIESDELQIIPEKRKNEVLGFLNQGLKDLCISRNRERLQWGVPLPFDDRYVTYVWVDALFNYESAIGYLSDDAARREEQARWWPADAHMIGKDILTTHSVYWPTMLLAVGEPLPRRILAHGWLLDPKGRKLSKSKALEGDEETTERPSPTIDGLIDVMGVDGTRWFLATAMRPGDDAAFDWETVRERVNMDLANGLGNSLNRLLKMAGSTCGGVFPGVGEPGETEGPLRAASDAAIEAARRVPSTLDATAVVSAVRAGVDAISAYLTEQEPWKLAKQDDTKARAGEVLAWSLETLRRLGLAVHPVLPRAMSALRESLGMQGELDFEREAAHAALPAGATLGAPPNLFPRVPEEALPSA